MVRNLYVSDVSRARNPDATVAAQVVPYESAPPYMGCCYAVIIPGSGSYQGPGHQFATKTVHLAASWSWSAAKLAGSGISKDTGDQLAAESGVDCEFTWQ